MDVGRLSMHRWPSAMWVVHHVQGLMSMSTRMLSTSNNERLTALHSLAHSHLIQLNVCITCFSSISTSKLFSEFLTGMMPDFDLCFPGLKPFFPIGCSFNFAERLPVWGQASHCCSLVEAFHNNLASATHSAVNFTVVTIITVVTVVVWQSHV